MPASSKDQDYCRKNLTGATGLVPAIPAAAATTTSIAPAAATPTPRRAAAAVLEYAHTRSVEIATVEGAQRRPHVLRVCILDNAHTCELVYLRHDRIARLSREILEVLCSAACHVHTVCSRNHSTKHRESLTPARLQAAHTHVPAMRRSKQDSQSSPVSKKNRTLTSQGRPHQDNHRPRIHTDVTRSRTARSTLCSRGRCQVGYVAVSRVRRVSLPEIILQD